MGSLIPERLRRVSSMVDVGRVTIRNSSEARYAIADDGTKWVKKFLGANELLAEALGTLLAMDLGVPTAHGGYWIDGSGERWWLSKVVEPVLHWKPAFAERLAEPSELGALLALDALIGNRDRHSGNILLRPSPNETDLRVYSIDVADSWIGTPFDLEHAGLDVPPVDNVARGIPVGIVADGARACAERAVGLPAHRVVDSCREACFIANEPDTSCPRLVSALTIRLESAPIIVEKYLELLEKL